MKFVRSVKIPFDSLKLMTAVRLSPESTSLIVKLPKGLTLASSAMFEVVALVMVGASLTEVALTTDDVSTTAADRWPSLTATEKVVETTEPTAVWLFVGSKVRALRALVTADGLPVME